MAAVGQPRASGPASQPFSCFRSVSFSPAISRRTTGATTPIDPEARSRGYSLFPPSGHLAFDVPAYIRWRAHMRNHAGLHPVPYLAGSKTTSVSVKLWESPGLAGGLPLLLKRAAPQLLGIRFLRISGRCQLSDDVSRYRIFERNVVDDDTIQVNEHCSRFRHFVVPESKPGTHPILYTCYPVSCPRLSRSQSRLAHLNLTTGKNWGPSYAFHFLATDTSARGTERALESAGALFVLSLLFHCRTSPTGCKEGFARRNKSVPGGMGRCQVYFLRILT